VNKHFTDHGFGMAQLKSNWFHAISKPVAGGANYAAHHHDTASLSILLYGFALEQRSRVHTIEREPGTIVCNPAGETHSLHFANAMAHSIVVEIDTVALARSTDFASTFDRANVWKAQNTSVWGLKLHQNLSVDGNDYCAVEDAVLELLAPVCDAAASASTPSWLKRARDKLRDAPDHCESIASLAAEAGVDAAHFAREFRRFYRRSASEYRLLSKLDYACRALLEQNAAPAEAAQIGGFADQSHFGRNLKRFARVTPTAARAVGALSEIQHQNRSIV
jgi:AraC-like DNA-binding protein